MLRVLPGKVTTKGIDVSHYDKEIDFAKVKAAGFVFVLSKCTEYTVDNTYATNRTKAKAAGLIFGAYDFFHPSKDPLAQAELYLKNVKLGPGDLIPMLDWETADNLGAASDHARAKIWLDAVEKSVGKKPMIYGGPYFLNAMSLDKSFADYPLYVAEYGARAPYVPPPWKNWTFWQYTSKGSVPGIPAPDEDMDIFNGSVENLRQLTL